MKTDVVTPHKVFYANCQLKVPMFQRRYVWNKVDQWIPLWEDIVGIVEEVDAGRVVPHHFLGAIVIQPGRQGLGELPTFHVIDGQQRLTTLQLLLAAMRVQFEERGLSDLGKQIGGLLINPESGYQSDAQRYKLQPTLCDVDCFRSVVDGEMCDDKDSQIEAGYTFFSTAIGEWLDADSEAVESRAETLAAVVQHKLQIAAISLDEGEDAQTTFEILNGRGTPLSPVDLIKNYVFYTFTGSESDAELLYQQYWAEFEDPWWAEEVTIAKLRDTRVVHFFAQWVVTHTRTYFPMRELFRRFKQCVTDSGWGIADLLARLHRAARIYRELQERSELPNGVLTRAEKCAYRTRATGIDVVRPLLMWLSEPEQADVADADKDAVIHLVESWAMRRMLIKLSPNSMDTTITGLLDVLDGSPKHLYPTGAAEFLTGKMSVDCLWPSDEQVRHYLNTMHTTSYRTVRVRVVLEAIEDARRGFEGGTPVSMAPVVRGCGTVEHVLPQNWAAHWGDGIDTEKDAERRGKAVHSFGNLTLLTKQLNGTVKDSPWEVKRGLLNAADDLLINRSIVACEAWDEEAIDKRTESLIHEVLKIWPSPHCDTAPEPELEEDFGSDPSMLRDLMRTGYLSEGAVLRFSNPKPQYDGVRARVTPTGHIELDGNLYDSLSAAAEMVLMCEVKYGWRSWKLEDTNERLSVIRYRRMLDL